MSVPRKQKTGVRMKKVALIAGITGQDGSYLEKLGWTPKIGFKELVSEMVRADLLFAERDELIKKHGYTIYNRNE